MMKSEELRLASEIFWTLVDRNGPMPPSHTKIKTRCWEWIGSVTKEGYGRFKFNQGTYYARRFAWTLSHFNQEVVNPPDAGARNLHASLPPVQALLTNAGRRIAPVRAA
jgi:hypothetical protein